MTQAKNLFLATSAIAATSDLLIAGTKDQFKVIQLYKNFPNTKNFCWFNNTNQTLQLPAEMKYMEQLLGYDGNIVITVSYINTFTIYNISNPKSPQKLSSFNLELVNLNFLEIHLSQNIASFGTGSDILALDISNVSSIKSLGFVAPDTAEPISTFTLSPRHQNIAFLVKRDLEGDGFSLRVLNFTEKSQMTETTFANLTSFPEFSILTHSNDGNLLFFSRNGTLDTYDVSTPTRPVFIASQKTITSAELTYRVIFIALSKDTKTLFTLTS